MQGIPSKCSICGAKGQKFGCPSFFDVCADKERCRDNLAYKLQKLQSRVKELENEAPIQK